MYTDGVQNRTVVNKIYDDFESRTCENCKHYKVESEACWNMRSFVYNLPIRIHKSYGCNEFVSTDTKSPQQD